MQWIVGAGEEIIVDGTQLKARREYIQSVTGANVSNWRPISLNSRVLCEFYLCGSDDGINGIFITAHINGVYNLCSISHVCQSDFVVANTCIWERLSHKELLYHMRQKNRDIELWFAKQELSVDNERTFRQSATLNNVGRFGFQTSLSERKLFTYRSKGLIQAIHKSFEHVSPIIFLGD